MKVKTYLFGKEMGFFFLCLPFAYDFMNFINILDCPTELIHKELISFKPLHASIFV